MRIYDDAGSRGPYGFDMRMIKQFKTNLLQSQHRHFLSLGMSWGCTSEYVLRNKRDYCLSLMDNIDTDNLPYSARRLDIWFGDYYKFKNDKEAQDHYNSQTTKLISKDLIETFDDGLAGRFCIPIKLGDMYQWNFRIGHTRPMDEFDSI